MAKLSMLFLLLVCLPAAALAQAAAKPAARRSLQVVRCVRYKQCKGPDIHGKHFALLAAPHASVAASVTKWGDFVRIRLIVSNSSTDTMPFNPHAVVAQMKSGKIVRPELVTELNEPSSGPGIMLGSGPADMGPVANVVGAADPNPRGPIDVDPEGRELGRLDKVMHDHQNELRAMLQHEMWPRELQPGETVAGYVVIQPPKDDLPVEVWVPFAGTVFALPVKG